MKAIQKILFLCLLSAPFIAFSQQDAPAKPDVKIDLKKFDITIIQSKDPNEQKLGVSITGYQEKFRYTFEWKVDGKPAGNAPLLKKVEGKEVSLCVTRYPGGDKVNASFEFEDEVCTLPLYPKQRRSESMLADFAYHKK